MVPEVSFPGGACDDTTSHACYVVHDFAVTVIVYVSIVAAICWVFWRFRWWPMSRLRARQERDDAALDALLAERHAREAGAPPPSEDELWEHFEPDA